MGKGPTHGHVLSSPNFPRGSECPVLECWVRTSSPPCRAGQVFPRGTTGQEKLYMALGLRTSGHEAQGLEYSTRAEEILTVRCKDVMRQSSWLA